MKPLAFSAVAALAALAAPALHAQEVARVLSSVPLIQQVSVPRQVCNTQNVVVDQPRSGAGALLGAVAGGAVGNQIGHGSGRAVATAAGLLGGAMPGNRIEGTTQQMQPQTQCSMQTVYENRAVGYTVTYEYAGKQYQVQLPQDPGPTLRVQVVPIAPGAQPTYGAPPAPAPLQMMQPLSGFAAPVVYASAAPAVWPVVAVAPVAYRTAFYESRPFHHHHGVHAGHGHRWN